MLYKIAGLTQITLNFKTLKVAIVDLIVYSGYMYWYETSANKERTFIKWYAFTLIVYTIPFKIYLEI